MTLPTILHPGEGKLVQIGTSRCTFKITGQDTHGHFGLFEFVLNLCHVQNWSFPRGKAIDFQAIRGSELQVSGWT